MPHGPYPAGDTRIMLTSSPELARLALQDAPEAMILVDAAGTVVFANLQAGRLFGFAQEALIGRTLDSLVPRRLREAHAGQADRNHRSPLARPVDQRLELYGVRHDGTEFPVEVSLGPIGSEGGSIVAAAIRDASEHRRIQGELTAARTTAEKALESAVRANQAKSRFLATASHDLRQPLQTLALLNGTLRRMVPDVQAARVLEQQENAIGAMSRLINALLDISKLESGSVKPEITDFPVAAIFEELRREFSDMAARKQLEFEITQAPQYARSDPSLVEQVLRNLLSNALKYTRRGKVALRCLLAPDSLLRLEVLDTGIGIPPDHLGSIYDEFYQIGADTNRARDGYGLGLSIVKRIVELLGLTLEVRSRPDEGSSFALLLPAAPGRAATLPELTAEPAARPASAAREAQRVLLVEDDAGVRDATRMLLRVEGYRVTAVASVEEALESAGVGIDILVTDYHLPGERNGTQLIAELRASLGGSLKAVLITADTSSAIRELPRDPDLRVASKPLKAEELLSLMGSLAGAGASPL